MHKILLATALVSNLNFMGILPALAQNLPAETYQPGFWQPVARVDTKLPVTIKLVNKTDFAVDYAVTTEKITPFGIKSQETTTITEVKIPLYLVIYPNSSNPNSSRINLKYSVQVDDNNVVTVNISEVDNNTPSNRTLNIQETGAIFLY